MFIDKTLVASRFARAVDTYDDEAAVQRRVADRLAQLVHCSLSRPPQNILEIGCGTGFLSRRLLELFNPARLDLNDLCPSMRERLDDILGPNVHFRAGDAEECVFPGERDLVASSSALQWFADPGSFLGRCRDLLADGGCLAFSAYGPGNFRQIERLTGAGLPYRNVDQWLALLGDGWNIVQASQERVDTTLPTPMAVLHHLRRTGVTGLRRCQWSVGDLRRFVSEYRRLFSGAGGVRLTYTPLYIVAIKQ